jgi:hypothetical protein
VLASLDNGASFTRSLTITAGPSGYSALQCGLPGREDCGILYDAMGGAGSMFSRFAFEDLKPFKSDDVDGATTLTNGVVSLEFELVLGDIVLTHLGPAESSGINLVANDSTAAPIWSVGVVGDGVDSAQVTSRAPCAARTIKLHERDDDGGQLLDLVWHGIAMMGANTTWALRVRLEAGEDTSYWSLSATNHDPTARFGLWNASVFFNGLQSKLDDSVFRPMGFGSIHNATLLGCSALDYPSNSATMSFSALGGSGAYGVYTAALDTDAQPKVLAYDVRGPSLRDDACCRSLIEGSDGEAPVWSGCVLGHRSVHAATASADFGYVHHVASPGESWAAFELGYELALGVLPLGGGGAAQPTARRDALWWEAAQRYRSWAMAAAPWAAGSHLSERDDMPEWWRDTHLMVNSHWQCVAPFNHSAAAPAVVLPRASHLASLVGNFTLHWYEWQQNFWMPGTSPDYLPSRGGFSSAVAELELQGVHVLPYIDAHLIDRNGSSWESTQSVSCSRASPIFGADELSFYQERWGTEHRSASQELVFGPSFSVLPDPACPLWQQKIGGLVGALVREQGTGGAYLDQLAAAKAYICYDRDHGHAPGGGGHWVDGVNKMLRAGRAAGGPGTVQITEGNAEPYMKDIQGYLVLGAFAQPLAPRADTRVPTPGQFFEHMMAPAFPAVYGGHYVCTGAMYSHNDFVDSDVFAARLAGSFCLGCQLGWFALGGTTKGQCDDGVSNNTDPCGDMGVYEKLVSEDHTAEVRFLNELLGWRREPAVRAHLQLGRLARPLPPQSAPSFLAPQVDHDNQTLVYPSEGYGPFPSLYAYMWIAAANDSLLLLCVNVRGTALQLDVKFNATLQGLTGGSEGVQVEEMEQSGDPVVVANTSSGSIVHIVRAVPARSVCALRITAAAAREEEGRLPPHKTDDRGRARSRRHPLTGRGRPHDDQTVNPLAGLPALKKVHHSWPLAANFTDPRMLPVLTDYARITHAVPVAMLGTVEQEIITAAVQICAKTGAILEFEYSPWMGGRWSPYPRDVLPMYAGPEEAAELALFTSRCAASQRLIAGLHWHQGFLRRPRPTLREPLCNISLENFCTSSVWTHFTLGPCGAQVDRAGQRGAGDEREPGRDPGRPGAVVRRLLPLPQRNERQRGGPSSCHHAPITAPHLIAASRPQQRARARSTAQPSRARTTSSIRRRRPAPPRRTSRCTTAARWAAAPARARTWSTPAGARRAGGTPSRRTSCRGRRGRSGCRSTRCPSSA